tara:strand:+ start:71 stop:220 length:150 start_codon:yes stop_codon:yes gene_type:complete
VVLTVALAVDHMALQALVQEIHHQYLLLKVITEEHKVQKAKAQEAVQLQ